MFLVFFQMNEVVIMVTSGEGGIWRFSVPQTMTTSIPQAFATSIPQTNTTSISQAIATSIPLTNNTSISQTIITTTSITYAYIPLYP